MAAAYERIARDRFRVALGRIASLDTDAPVLIEGRFLLPDLIAPFVASPRLAVFVVAAAAAQREALAPRRRAGRDAADARILRDQALADGIRGRASALGFSVLEVESPAETLGVLEDRFLPLLAEWLSGANRGDVAARRRDMNGDRLRYVRARMAATGVSTGPALKLRCECPEADCAASLAVTLEAAEAARAAGRPLLAPGHGGG
jgi:hypothetical protein